MESGDLTAARQHLGRAEAGWPAAPPPAAVALHLLVRSRLAGFAADPAGMARATTELDEIGLRLDPDVGLMGELDAALTHVILGRPGDGRRLAENVRVEARRHGRGYLAARSLALLAGVAGAEGDYGRMAELGDLAAGELGRGGWGATAGSGLVAVVRAYAALLDARPVRCLDLLGAPVPADPLTDGLEPLRHALRAAALVDLDRREQAMPELRDAQVAMAARPLPPSLTAPAVLLVHGSATELHRPDIAAEALSLAEGVLGAAAEIVLMRARTAVARSTVTSSTAVALRPVLDGSVAAVVPWAVIEIRVLACDLALASGRPLQARRELMGALSAAAVSGALRPLLAGGPAVADLIALQLGSFGAGDAAAARVLEFRGVPRPGDVPLTDRERAVLGLLATPRSLHDIALELDVAPSTVKTHLRAIYLKLGVTTRRGAVVAGRRRGALAPAPTDPPTSSTGPR
jgi:LuxR family maltose regulon positive regulatory protein